MEEIKATLKVGNIPEMDAAIASPYRLLVVEGALGEHDDLPNVDHGEELLGLVVERGDADLAAVGAAEVKGEELAIALEPAPPSREE